MEYIRLKTRKAFIDTMNTYKKDWRIYIWDYFKENTCYIPDENCFISLERAKQLNYLEI